MPDQMKLSPDVKAALQKVVDLAAFVAKFTPTPIDDAAVKLLQFLLSSDVLLEDLIKQFNSR
jgi:hypothetical protein